MLFFFLQNLQEKEHLRQINAVSRGICVCTEPHLSLRGCSGTSSHPFPLLPPSPSLQACMYPSYTHTQHTHTHTHTHPPPLSVLPVTSAVDLRLNFDELLFFFNFIFKASQLNGYCYEALGELQKKAGKEQGNALVFAQSS